MKQDVIPGDRNRLEPDIRRDPTPGEVGASLEQSGGSQTYVQRFTMAVEFPVVFIEDLFHPANPALADVVSRQEPGKRHRLFVVLDDGVAGALPDLTARLEAYAAHHDTRLELLAIDLVAGGEGIKNQTGVVDGLLRRMLELAVDRHSYVVAIGGGAVLSDVSAYGTN